MVAVERIYAVAMQVVDLLVGKAFVGLPPGTPKRSRNNFVNLTYACGGDIDCR